MGWGDKRLLQHHKTEQLPILYYLNILQMQKKNIPSMPDVSKATRYWYSLFVLFLSRFLQKSNTFKFDSTVL